MALTLLRHGALALRHQKRYNGWTDIPLDVTRFDEVMVKPLIKQKFDMVVSSDLKRCQETLMLMDKTPYTTDARLREVRFKIHIEGLRFEEVALRADYKASFLEDEKKWHTYVCAESYEAFRGRIHAFLQALPPDKEILVCTHGGVMRQMLSLLHLPPLKTIAYLDWIRIEHYEL